MSEQKVTVHTDGACSGNPGPGGWGAILSFGEHLKELMGGEAHTTFAERFDAAYRAELAAFVELALGERENPCTPEDAVAASRVADAAQESLETGAPVRVEVPARA